MFHPWCFLETNDAKVRCCFFDGIRGLLSWLVYFLFASFVKSHEFEERPTYFDVACSLMFA